MAWSKPVSGESYDFTSDGGTTSGSANTLTLTNPSSTTNTADSVLVVFVAADNAASGDSQTSLVSSVTDAASNTYTRIAEFTNGNAAAAAGATVSVWMSKLSNTLSVAGNAAGITVNFASNISARGAAARRYDKGSGNTVSIATFVTNATDAASPATMTISGLSNREYLWIHALAHEGSTTDSIANSTNYSTITSKFGTSGGGGAANMTAVFEDRINTATSDIVKINAAAADHAQIFAALVEEAATQSGTATLAFSQDATLKGDGALVASANQGITFGENASLTGSGALVGTGTIAFDGTGALGAFAFGTGTASLTFADNATLTGSGALVAAAGQGITFGQNATLAATGALVGAASLTFSQDATLKGDLPAQGTASIVFNQDATLTGTANLVGATTITFGENATLGTAASEALIGVASLTFAENASLTGSGALVGAGALTFGQDATLKGDLPAVGTASLTFGQNATLGGSAGLVGAASLTFGQNATAVGSGALAGTGTVDFAQNATLQGAGALTGAGTVTFGQDATLAGSGAMVGSASVTFAQNATLTQTADGAMVGSASITFGQNAILVGDLGLSAIAELVFGASGTLNRPVDAEEEVSRPRPDDGPGRSIYKPTGLTYKKPKAKLTARKEVSDRVEESREIAEEISAQVAREFAEENRNLKPIQQMSQAEIAAEIAARLQPLANMQSLPVSGDDEILLLMMAGI